MRVIAEQLIHVALVVLRSGRIPQLKLKYVFVKYLCYFVYWVCQVVASASNRVCRDLDTQESALQKKFIQLLIRVRLFK